MYKPIEIDEETKLNISTVLRYYRSYLKIKQSDFIRYKEASVCSADTYSRIENGKIIKRNSIYIYLLYQIQATYEYFPPFWKQQQPLFHKLTSSLEAYNMEEFQRTCKELQSILKDSKDYLAREIYELLDVCIAFYDRELSLSEYHFQKYKEICRIFPAALQDIVKDMLYQCTFRHQRNLVQCQELYHQFHIEASTSPLLMIDQCREYLFEGRYLESHAVALKLEQKFTSENNYQRLLDVYEVLLILYRKIQGRFHPFSYNQKFFDLIQKHGDSFHHSKYLQSLYIHGLIQYHEGNFQDAYHCFHRLAESDSEHFLPAALFVNIIVDKLQDEKSTLLKPLNAHHHYPNHLAAFYQYFIYKQEGQTADDLEAFLVHNVLPYVVPSDMVFWEPLKEELLNLIKITKHYYIKKKLCEECL